MTDSYLEGHIPKKSNGKPDFEKEMELIQLEKKRLGLDHEEEETETY